MLYDKDIREPLLEYLEVCYGKVRIIEEKRMGSSRADIIMVTDQALCGIEIKSDADTYARLAGQVKDYDRYFRYNIVAVGGSHGLQIRDHVPAHWGIITIDEEDGKPDFYFLRKPTENMARNPEEMLKILWKGELAELQSKYAMPAYPGKSKDFIRKKIMERIPEVVTAENLEKEICRVLFERDYELYEAALKEKRQRKSSGGSKRCGRRKSRRKASTKIETIAEAIDRRKKENE